MPPVLSRRRTRLQRSTNGRLHGRPYPFIRGPNWPILPTFKPSFQRNRRTTGPYPTPSGSSLSQCPSWAWLLTAYRSVARDTHATCLHRLTTRGARSVTTLEALSNDPFRWAPSLDCRLGWMRAAGTHAVSSGLLRRLGDFINLLCCLSTIPSQLDACGTRVLSYTIHFIHWNPYNQSQHNASEGQPQRCVIIRVGCPLGRNFDEKTPT